MRDSVARFVMPAVVALTAGCAPSAGPLDTNEARITRVTSSLRRAVLVRGVAERTFTLDDRMVRYRTPGISVAVADGGRIVWARGYGVKEAATADSVTVETLFEAGSISKPVAATAMLALVEQGVVSLDRDVNEYLRSWTVPDNRFTAREKVTLRRLASHNAGLTVHGFPGYRVTDALPTIPEILDGRPPANTAPVRVDTVPGSIFRYSGGGTTVMQLVLTDVTGRPFPVLMRQLVLEPLGMTRSTFEQPLPSARVPETAAAHLQDGTVVPGRWHVYPEMAAAGLWSTPSELLGWAIAIADLWAGRSSGPLSQSTARTMLTPGKGGVGLGPFVEGSGRAFRFGHDGADRGFHAQLVYFPETGQGAAVMGNGDGGGQALLREVMLAIAREYDWPDYGPREIDAVEVEPDLVDAVLGEYRGTTPVPFTVAVVREGRAVYASSQFIPRSEVVFTAPDRAVLLETDVTMRFERDSLGGVRAVAAGHFRADRVR